MEQVGEYGPSGPAVRETFCHLCEHSWKKVRGYVFNIFLGRLKQSGPSYIEIYASLWVKELVNLNTEPS